MCGQYVSPEQAAIERAFAVTMPLFDRSYNVAPAQPVPVVRSKDGQREGALMRWGLIPFFARGVPPKYSTISARLETVETSPAYRGRGPWKRAQRCIQPASGFYEWHLGEDGKKNPFFENESYMSRGRSCGPVMDQK
jgi:putative SOS response-associated peptidase YedK